VADVAQATRVTGEARAAAPADRTAARSLGLRGGARPGSAVEGGTAVGGTRSPGVDEPHRRRSRVIGWLQAVLAGLAGAAALSLAPFVQHLTTPGPVLPLERLPVWTAAVVGVAVAEEVLLRGVLWRAVLRSTADPARAPWLALAVTTVAFAVLHVPFYGIGSLPVDLAAGLLLGALRQLTGSVTAPVVAHLAADLAGWWLQ
jgi:membrane protease YdiL (CAAX protease family)